VRLLNTPGIMRNGTSKGRRQLPRLPIANSANPSIVTFV
jgi:hypothetical protein